MFHVSIADSYTRQHALFKRLVSMAFTLAGVYWLVMYGMEWGGLLNDEDMQVLRSGQSIIYFVLLTLWGVEYLRETRRLKAVWSIAGEKVGPPQEVTADEILEHGPKFGVLRPVAFGKPSWVLPAVNDIGLVIGYALIVMQYLRLIWRATGVE